MAGNSDSEERNKPKRKKERQESERRQSNGKKQRSKTSQQGRRIGRTREIETEEKQRE
jgi:hypothetical protein